MKNTIDKYLVGRQNNFDLIRLIAAIAVIFSHSFPLTSDLNEPLAQFSSEKLSFGGLSVAIFFIISGLLITQSYTRSSSLMSYSYARILRIYPALFVVILISVFLLGPAFTSLPTGKYFTDPATLKYLLNVLAVRMQFVLPGVFQDNFYPNTVNGSLWTLPLEIACYGLVAGVGSIFRRHFVWGILLTITVTLIFQYSLRNVNTYYFALGSAMYMFKDRIKIKHSLGIVSFLLFITNLYWTENQYLFRVVNGIVLSYLIVYIGFLKPGKFVNVSKFGDFSYGLYIYAFPVQQVLYFYLPDLNILSHFVVSALITLVFAIASWHFVEKRALALKGKLPRFDLIVGSFIRQKAPYILRKTTS